MRRATYSITSIPQVGSLPLSRIPIAEKYGCERTRRAIRLAGRWWANRSEGAPLSPVSVMGAVFNLNHPAHTVDWSFIHLSVANVVVIGLMLIVFALAILLPFPGRRARAAARRGGGAS